MMDIVEQLKADVRFWAEKYSDDTTTLRAEIERLREENEALRGVVMNMIGKEFEHVKIISHKPKSKRPSTKGY